MTEAVGVFQAVPAVRWVGSTVRKAGRWRLVVGVELSERAFVRQRLQRGDARVFGRGDMLKAGVNVVRSALPRRIRRADADPAPGGRQPEGGDPERQRPGHAPGGDTPPLGEVRRDRHG